MSAALRRRRQSGGDARGADAFDGDESYRCHLAVLQFWNQRAPEFDRAYECARSLGLHEQAAQPGALYALMLLDARASIRSASARRDFSQTFDIAADAYRRDDRAALTRMARYSTGPVPGRHRHVPARRPPVRHARDYPNNPAALLDVGSKLAMGRRLAGRARPRGARRDLSSNIPAWFDISGVVDAIRRKGSAGRRALHAAALETRHPLLLLVDIAAQKQGGSSATRAKPPATGRIRLCRNGSLRKLLDGQCWTPEARPCCGGGHGDRHRGLTGFDLTPLLAYKTLLRRSIGAPIA